MKYGALVFEGGKAGGPIEGWVARVREELCLDLMRRLAATGCFDEVAAVTDRPALARRASAEAGARAVLGAGEPIGEFHFGCRLNQVIDELRLDSFLYMSGGSGALMADAELMAFAAAVLADKGSIVANNVYSADMFGCADARCIADAGIPAVDNQVPMWAAAERGVRPVGLEPTVGASFDIDTPADLLVFLRAAEAFRPLIQGVAQLVADGPCARAWPRLQAASAKLGVDLAEIALFGRVSPVTVSHLNSATKCRIRAFSEERGMRAFGRDVPGGARSLIGRLAERVGFRQFFADLAWCADAALIDSRVVFAHLGAALSAEERFASDLFLWEQVGHAGAAEFTHVAAESEIPVALGGHCLVSGGVRALAVREHWGDVL